MVRRARRFIKGTMGTEGIMGIMGLFPEIPIIPAFPEIPENSPKKATPFNNINLPKPHHPNFLREGVRLGLVRSTTKFLARRG